MPKILERPLAQDIVNGRLLSFKETMAYLNVSKRTLIDMALKWRDRLPSYKVGKRRVFKLDELNYWIENHREPV